MDGWSGIGSISRIRLWDGVISFFRPLPDGFSSGHVWIWELDCKESWALKNQCFWTVVLERTLESPLDFKEIQPVHSEGDKPWIVFGRTDAEAEIPVLWPPDAKNWLIGKDPDAGKDWRQEEKGTTEDEMVGWHHRLNGRLNELRELVMHGETWRAAIHGVAKSRTRLSKWTELNSMSIGWSISFSPRGSQETTVSPSNVGLEV